VKYFILLNKVEGEKACWAIFLIVRLVEWTLMSDKIAPPRRQQLPLTGKDRIYIILARRIGES
jgi:hypothetical protein